MGDQDLSASSPTSWMLFLRHSGEYDTTYINAWLNPSQTPPYFGMLLLNPPPPTNPPNRGTSFPSTVWGVGDPIFAIGGVTGGGIGSMFACNVFGLSPDPTINDANFYDMIDGDYIPPGLPNILQLGQEQTVYTRNNYLVGGVAIQPYDVRIEAVLYAQQGSFFVLPGNRFNPNTGDQPGVGVARTSATRDPWVDPRFPFYGDPLDIRIIVDGAVSENIPASVSDVSEWMSKWGWIPPNYGSSAVPTAHQDKGVNNGQGFTILYDDHCGWPVTDLSYGASSYTPIRSDQFGRALPFTPNLPVTQGLVYLAM